MGGTNHILMQISEIFHEGRAFGTPTLNYAQAAIYTMLLAHWQGINTYKL